MNFLTQTEFTSKPYGHELTFANVLDGPVSEVNGEILSKVSYCGKIIFIKAGMKNSFHYHRLKDEVFYVLKGKLEIVYRTEKTSGMQFDRLLKGVRENDKIQKDYVNLLYKQAIREVLKKGDVIRLKPYTVHQFNPITDTTVVEVSSHHKDEDSYRLIENGVFNV